MTPRRLGTSGIASAPSLSEDQLVVEGGARQSARGFGAGRDDHVLRAERAAPRLDHDLPAVGAPSRRSCRVPWKNVTLFFLNR